MTPVRRYSDSCHDFVRELILTINVNYLGKVLDGENNSGSDIVRAVSRKQKKMVELFLRHNKKVRGIGDYKPAIVAAI